MVKEKWYKITREERFFCAVLFHDMMTDFSPFWNLIRTKLPEVLDINFEDVGFYYEVCFFRDAEKAGHFEEITDKKEKKRLFKRTFDFMLFLPDNTAIIIEAKAQQGYKTAQLEELKESIIKIKSNKKYPIKECYLVGLASSKNRMKDSTKEYFDAIITWNEIVDIYKQDIYKRADDLYRN